MPRWRMSASAAPRYEHTAHLLELPAGVRIPTLTVEVWFRTTFMGGPTRHVLGSGQACSTVTWRNSCCRAADGLLRLQLEGRKAERPPSGAPQIDFGQLLDAYRAVQTKHRAKDDGKRREARVGDGAEAGDAAPAAK